MADQRNGGIAWTDVTWNPIRGCTPLSAGCKNCYAARVAGRFCGDGMPYAGLVRITPSGNTQWTGEVRFIRERLADPLGWRRALRVFCASRKRFDEWPEDMRVREFPLSQS